MRVLDLFCGAGGAAVGYAQAGFDVVGVDVEPQPSFPYEFVQADALEPPVRLNDFDLIHASPPCQHYSVATADRSRHPDYVDKVRDLLAGHTYVIENVIQAPLRPDLKLCGSMFDLQVQRHRVFEIEGFFIWGPPVCKHEWEEGRAWTVVGNPGGRKPLEERAKRSYTHSFKYKDLEHGRTLMEMPWVKNRRELIEAIPPAYTRYIGSQFLEPGTLPGPGRMSDVVKENSQVKSFELKDGGERSKEGLE